ncbi:MAG: LOG family protein [Acidobacteria bacterium]|nr:LOG family protein [Acidobacteriota bacterium]
MQPLAYRDHAFLDSDEARPLRILAEYHEPLARFTAQHIQDTVVFFGSARTLSREDSTSVLERLRAGAPDGTGTPSDEDVARAEAAVEWSRYYEEARELAKLLTAWSLALGTAHQRFVVTSGGGPGIMEAANRGATEAGGKTIGLNIRLPFEQGPNPYITEGLHFEFRYFFMRKFWFAYLAKSLVIFPGGFGTLDEMFDILTLMQTDKLAANIQIVLYGSEYWNRVLSFDALRDAGAVNTSDVRLLDRADTPSQAFELLRSHLTGHHLPPAGVPTPAVPEIAKTRF